jgi:ADP-heptose:LPS heptosyltransferase
LARLAATRLSGRAPSRRLVDPCFPIQADERAWARAWITSSFEGQVGDGPVVALHPGSGAVLKNWLPERWAELVRALRADRQARVFVTGGPGDREVVESIAAGLDPRPAILVGETSLGQLAALFACSDLVLGCDSGPLHLAAAVGTRTARLYGPTDPVEFGPWAPRGHDALHPVIAASLPCQPCRVLVEPPCGAVEQPACMRAIGVGDVLSAADDLLAAAREPC